MGGNGNATEPDGACNTQMGMSPRGLVDFITHSLCGVAAARLLVPRSPDRSQVCLAALLGSLLPDADSWLALLGPDMYGRYHRVITHSVVGLLGVTLLASGLAYTAAGAIRGRRFGWFVSPSAPPGTAPRRLPYSALLVAALLGAALHWTADWITGFGNLKPFWPWSDTEFSLNAVNSFDFVLFTSTLLLHLYLRKENMPRAWEAWFTAAWLALCLVYVGARATFGESTAW